MRFIFYFIFLRWFFRIVFFAATDPVETLTVKVEADTSALLDGIAKDVDKGKEKLEEFDDSVKKTGKTFVDSAGRMRDEFGRYVKTTDGAGETVKGFGIKAGAAFGLAAGAAGILLDIVINLAVAIPQMFIALGKEGVAANAEFETFAVQFETLLGSADAAQGRLEELAQFGVETPFELPEIVEASRTLQTFGGTALATGDNLRMIGDIAAGVNQPFQDVAFWIGRMYDAMQNGQPFGEASARLQEMGALTGDTRRKLEQMQKTGEDGAKIFAVFSDEVGGRFTGNMERLSGTFQGVTSNLADFRGNLLRVGTEPIFEEVRQSAIDFLAILDENAPAIEMIAVSIGEMAASVIRFGREGLGSINIKPVIEGIKSFFGWLEKTRFATGAFVTQFLALNKAVEAVLAPLRAMGKAILGVLLGPLINQLSGLWTILTRIPEAMVTAAKGTAIITAVISGLTETVKGALVAIGGMGKALGSLLTGNLEGLKNGLKQANEGIAQLTQGGAAAFKESMLESAKSIDAMINPLEDATEAVEALNDEMKDTPEIEVPLLDQGKLDSFSNQLIEATENRAKEQEKLEADHAQKTLDIINDANDKALDTEKKHTDDLEDLTQETEKKRLDIIEGTRRDLAKLADETDRDLTDKRKEFNKDEQRETEDHLKEMRRMQEDHLLDLEDAVRSRDAGAIVDLQRRFATESSRKEEDFQQGQSREKSDFSDELNRTRENESQRRNELLTKQSEQLDDLRQHEEEKRAEIEMRRVEENEKLQQNLQERLQKENDSYIQRQATLDEALQKQLAAIAKNLADEKEVTEEGAREILETFDEYFGIGGNIDELMSDFSRRRKIRADITVAFSGEQSEPETPSEALASGGSFGGRKRLGGVQKFAEGGTLIAEKPTLALFGEAGPEIAQFTPMSQLSSPGSGGEPGRMVIEMTGSAPPGIGAGERDQIAAVLLTALQDSGALN